MLGAETWTLDSAVDSLALWWREAGLHTLTTDEPHDWFAANTASRPAISPISATASARDLVSDPVSRSAPVAGGPAIEAPGDLPVFLAWLEQDAGQPDAAWSGPALLPPTTIDAALMVVSEIPGETSDALLDPPARALLDAMLAALGMRLDDAAISTLTVRRPAGGLIVEELLAPLGARFRHYLGLSRPRAILVLGDRTARALGVTNDSPGDGAPGHGLQSVKISAGTIPAAAIPHPALLMRRPRAKAESWKRVRHLSGVLR